VSKNTLDQALERLDSKIEKLGFLPPQEAAAGMPPEMGMMDPAMMGGMAGAPAPMPPMDPAMMGMPPGPMSPMPPEPGADAVMLNLEDLRLVVREIIDEFQGGGGKKKAPSQKQTDGKETDARISRLEQQIEEMASAMAMMGLPMPVGSPVSEGPAAPEGIESLLPQAPHLVAGTDTPRDNRALLGVIQKMNQ